MILTCPKCNSQYRVRNESIPAEGAKLKCPQCELEFHAQPPEREAAEIQTVLTQLDAARAKLDAEYFELTGTKINSKETAAPWRSWGFSAAAALQDNLDELQKSVVLLEANSKVSGELSDTIAFMRQLHDTLKKLQKAQPEH